MEEVALIKREKLKRIWGGFFNSVEMNEVFVCEAQGLAEISASKTVRVPEVVAQFEANRRVYLVL